MNDYLDGAESDLIKRGSLLLGKIPSNLPSEFRLLAQKCRDKLIDDLDKVRLLNQLPLSSRLRKFKRLVDHIDFLEVNGIAALNRSNEDDRYINILIDQIVKEINYPLLPPMVSLLSQGYFYCLPELGLLAIPLGEADSLLHLPDLYHELAHFLVNQQYEPRAQPFRKGLNQGLNIIEEYIAKELEQEKGRAPKAFSNYLRTWLKSWTEGWLIESFCDLFATCTVGPAFAWAHLHLCFKRGGDPFEISRYISSTHPADDARLKLMLLTLDQMGFSDEANKISSRWKEYIKLAGYQPEPEYSRCYPYLLLQDLGKIALESIKIMGCRITKPNTKGTIHEILNQAWHQFWKNPKDYCDWETNAILNLRNSLVFES